MFQIFPSKCDVIKSCFRIITSIPIDLSSPGDEELAKLEEKGVKAKYASVEQILELPDGKVEWKMATSSSPGTHRDKPVDNISHYYRWRYTSDARGIYHAWQDL